MEVNMEKDKYELLEEHVIEFIEKLEKIGFSVLGGGRSGAIELEIVETDSILYQELEKLL